MLDKEYYGLLRPTGLRDHHQTLLYDSKQKYICMYLFKMSKFSMISIVTDLLCCISSDTTLAAVPFVLIESDILYLYKFIREKMRVTHNQMKIIISPVWNKKVGLLGVQVFPFSFNSEKKFSFFSFSFFFFYIF